jgi:hypothetical protein
MDEQSPESSMYDELTGRFRETLETSVHFVVHVPYGCF